MPLDLNLPLVERYRQSHHAIASMIAAGMTDAMIRRKTGISLRRLCLLQASPSFQELIALKAQRVAELFDQNLDAYLDLGMSNMIRAESQIADHLDASEDNDELLPVSVLDRISQGRADRFGYSKHAVLHHDHSFAEQLERAVLRSGKTIEAISTPALPAGPAPKLAQDVALAEAQPKTLEPKAAPRPLSNIRTLRPKGP